VIFYFDHAIGRRLVKVAGRNRAGAIDQAAKLGLDRRLLIKSHKLAQGGGEARSGD